MAMFICLGFQAWMSNQITLVTAFWWRSGVKLVTVKLGCKNMLQFVLKMGVGVNVSIG